MNITIVGPRSVGKTTVSKIVSKMLKKKYISSDEIGEKALKKYGGLDEAIKSGKIKEVINSGGYSLILKVYSTEKNFVFDLSAGAFTSRNMEKASEEVRNAAKNNSLIFGLLPSKNYLASVIFLFNREKKRIHFKDTNKIKLLFNTFRKYNHIKKIILNNTNQIIYVKNKSPEKIAKEILSKIKLYNKIK